MAEGSTAGDERLPAAPPFFAIGPGASQSFFDQNVADVAAANSGRHSPSGLPLDFKIA